MASTEATRSRRLGANRSKHSAISSPPSDQKRPRRHRSAKRRKKRERLPASLRYKETKRGKTAIRRYDGRSVYRLHEVNGKTVDFVEVFLAAEYSSINVRFDDKTTLSFRVEPGFTLEPEYYDWKTGNWRGIKRWPLIRSESHRIKR